MASVDPEGSSRTTAACRLSAPARQLHRARCVSVDADAMLAFFSSAFLVPGASMPGAHGQRSRYCGWAGCSACARTGRVRRPLLPTRDAVGNYRALRATPASQRRWCCCCNSRLPSIVPAHSLRLAPLLPHPRPGTGHGGVAICDRRRADRGHIQARTYVQSSHRSRCGVAGRQVPGILQNPRIVEELQFALYPQGKLRDTKTLAQSGRCLKELDGRGAADLGGFDDRGGNGFTADRGLEDFGFVLGQCRADGQGVELVAA